MTCLAAGGTHAWAIAGSEGSVAGAVSATLADGSSGISNRKSTMKLPYWVRRTHKWIGLIVGVQALLWMISGVYMT